MDTTSNIRIPDLTDEAREELAREMPTGTVRFEDATETTLARDWATTTAIVVPTYAALRGLALWITRHTTRQETEVTVQTQGSDGSTKTIHFRSKSASSQTEEGVLKQLAAACKIDLEASPAESIKELMSSFSKGKTDDTA